MASDEGDRKLAAILSADVVGYSKLMADDERATVNTLKEYHKGGFPGLHICPTTCLRCSPLHRYRR